MYKIDRRGGPWGGGSKNRILGQTRVQKSLSRKLPPYILKSNLMRNRPLLLQISLNTRLKINQSSLKSVKRKITS